MLNHKSPISTNAVGVGLRHEHHEFVLKNKPEVKWFEIHGENFFSKGGPSLKFIKEISNRYPLSIHCVGLSLGSCDIVDKNHLENLKKLIAATKPFLVSDHISWSNVDGQVLNDLLPIPYTKESLKILCNNIDQTQNYLNREILVENPSTYLSFKSSDMSEYEFIGEVAKRTGCKILLDINNIYVSSQNNNFDALKYLGEINSDIVAQMHLAGHSKYEKDGKTILIDTHDDFVCDEVWNLYKIAVKKFQVPTLIEWDQNLPEFDELLGEVKNAEKIIRDQNLNSKQHGVG